ncbi:MAG: hypothetical protein KBT06_02560 [Prevotellaceae bacterium]|nr:hypothetical protein [Candidatus Colivivens equi]MCQ2077180.1 hypothetical protein [Bacteroidaceae bacterium]
MIKQYKVGRLPYRIEFLEGPNDESLIPSSAPFETEVDDCDCLFSLVVNDSFRPEKKGEEIGQFDCGGNNHGVYLLEDGSYQILVSDVLGRKCCLLQAKPDFSQGVVTLRGDQQMRSFGLNNCLMMMYAFASSTQNSLLMHSSVIRKEGIGYLFLGVSGTGKSTHTANWMKYIEGTDLINDDNPVVRFIDGKMYVFGSPWSGKTPCYKNTEAPIGGYVQLKQAPYNKIRKMDVIESFASLLPSCSVMKWDQRVYGGVCDTVARIIETVPVYLLENLPDEDAVRLSYNTIHQNKM